MENSIENINKPEQKEEVEVILHLFRHGEQNKDPQKTNQEYELTSKGREQAVKKSQEIGGERNLKKTASIGSPRVRARQTAAFVMASKYIDTITGEESLDELKIKLGKGKVRTEPKLDFFLDKNTPFGQEAYKAVFADKNYMEFLVERSDELAQELNDNKASTYSRQASNIAQIIEKYATLSNRLSENLKDDQCKEAKFERFLGSHGGVVESFLLKVIEKTKGLDERNELLKILPHQFDFTEGVDIKLIADKQNQKIRITYKKVDPENNENTFIFDEDVPLETIKEIAEEGKISFEKFKEWTESKETNEAITNIYNHIRNIPYAVVPNRDPKNAQEELLIENRGSCTAKHVLLKEMLDKLGVKSRFVSHRFKWAEIPAEYPDNLKKLSEKMPVCDHLFCQALIDGKWVDMDASWDPLLINAGFPANSNWDINSDAVTAVKPLEIIFPKDIKERTKLKKEMVEKYTESECTVQPEFYSTFNEWLEKIRSENN